jgi:hypothetical protein
MQVFIFKDIHYILHMSFETNIGGEQVGAFAATCECWRIYLVPSGA